MHQGGFDYFLLFLVVSIWFLLFAGECSGYCTFPIFLWQQHERLNNGNQKFYHRNQKHLSDRIIQTEHSASDENSNEIQRRWIERVITGKPPTSTDIRWSLSETFGSATNAVWEIQRDVTARSTELIVEQRMRTQCGGDSSNTVACYRHESTSNIVCLAEEPMGKYRVLETDNDGNTMFSCIQFIKRNANVLQVYRAQLRDINEDRLCYDESLHRNDWVWTAVDDIHWTYCSVQGGFDFTSTQEDSGNRLCRNVWRPSRLETECIKGDGLTFYFPRTDCSPFKASAGSTSNTVERFQCLATWNEDLFRFILFTPTSRSHQRYVLRTPRDVDELDIFAASLYLGPIAPLNHTTFSSNYVTTYQLLMLRSEPGVCFDESASCRDFAREGRCTSAAVHQYANYCKHSCGLCDFAPSTKAECSFAKDFLGYWVFFSDNDREEAAIEDGEVRFSTLGRFTCKSKHWEEDYYKVFSSYTNGCRPRYSCIRFSKTDGSSLLLSKSPSDLTDKSFDLCDFRENTNATSHQLNSLRSKLLIPMSNLIKSGCGINGQFRADYEFANGVQCYNGVVSDITYIHQVQRCELKNSLSLGLPSGCRRITNTATIELKCLAFVRLSDEFNLLVSQLNSSFHLPEKHYTCWLFSDLVDESHQFLVQVRRASCDTGHVMVFPRTSDELSTIRLYKDVHGEALCVGQKNFNRSRDSLPKHHASTTVLSLLNLTHFLPLSTSEAIIEDHLNEPLASSESYFDGSESSAKQREWPPTIKQEHSNRAAASETNFPDPSAGSMKIANGAYQTGSRIRKQPEKQLRALDADSTRNRISSYSSNTVSIVPGPLGKARYLMTFLAVLHLTVLAVR